MPFRFYITEEGPYNAAQLANVRAALEFAGEKVQNTYQFEREITVDVKFENMANYGGGARGNPLLLRLINGVVYPTSIAKQGFSEEEWNSWVEEAPHRSKRDIGISFCYMSDWYTGTDGNLNYGQTDFVSYAMHELHHGLGWYVMDFDEEGGEDGIPKRMVRKVMQKELCFEKYVCFLTTEDNYCPIAPYFSVNQVGLTEEEKTFREEKLARILTSGHLYFRAGNNNIKLYSPPVFDEGTSIIHIDFEQEENAVMEPYDRDVFVKHTIRPQEQQVVTHMRDFTHLAPQECIDGNAEPKMARDGEKIYRHAKNKTGSVSNITRLKVTKTIRKKTKGQSKAVTIVTQTFKIILRLDVQFKARLQMVNFNSAKMALFNAHQKTSGIVVHHRQDVEVDGVFLPIAVARQIRGPKTIRRRAAHPRYWYDIDIFVDKNVKWDYKTTAQSAPGYMGFQSTLLRQLCEAFRFTNSSEYLQTKTDKKGNQTLNAIGRKLFLDRDFAKVWMRPTADSNLRRGA